MTQDEIQTAILQVCKVAGHDGDFNVVGFYVLCDRLKQLGAEEENEACHALRQTLPNPHINCQVSAHAYDMAIVEYGRVIRARKEVSDVNPV